jgi:SagB-type dehydrogenase family enzyme
MRKELSSFLLLFFLGTCVVLSILLINAKRELLSKSTPVTPPVAKAAPEIQTTLPEERTYVKTVALPQPKEAGSLDVEAALAQRRSRRTFDDKPVTLAQLSQMLWAGQGITDPEGNKRTAPSARNVYFFSIFVVVRDVDGLEPGLYEYLPEKHALGNMQVADAGALLTEAGVQDAAQKSPVVFLLSAAYGKGAESMKESAKSSALLEGGHIGQNLYLQAESLQMATVAMAGFDAAKVGSALQLDPAETVVYIYPFGHQAPETAEESTHE